MLVETPTKPLSAKEIEILVGHLQALCVRYPVNLCYLYGSQVRGTAHALSDVDVGFLLDEMDRKVCQEMWIDLYDAVSRCCPDHEVDLVILSTRTKVLKHFFGSVPRYSKGYQQSKCVRIYGQVLNG
jgi:predicted nucleotidyltransferase